MAVMRNSRRDSRRRLAALSLTATAALAASLVSALPAAAAPEGRVQYAGAATAVADSYIVTLRADHARSGSQAGRALVERYGAGIERTYKKALNGYAIEASATEAKRLAADPAVASVVQNRTFSIDATQSMPATTWAVVPEPELFSTRTPTTLAFLATP